MTRLSFAIFVAVAIALLMINSIPHLRAGGKETGPMGEATARTPVLVELFTSEACSSCPPADAVLQNLDRTQPVPNAELVVLSEHVDYWNGTGWTDPYSSRDFTTRQTDYAFRFRLDGPYTPQMVVDGDAQLVGSDEREVIHVVDIAAKAAKLPVTLSSIQLEGNNTLSVHVEAGPAPSGRKPPSAQVWIALADDSDQSIVRHGENAGRTLAHVAVVRSLTQVGALDRGGAFSATVQVDAANAIAKHLRVIVIVQEAHQGRVIGVAEARLPD